MSGPAQVRKEDKFLPRMQATGGGVGDVCEALQLQHHEEQQHGQLYTHRQGDHGPQQGLLHEERWGLVIFICEKIIIYFLLFLLLIIIINIEMCYYCCCCLCYSYYHLKNVYSQKKFLL